MIHCFTECIIKSDDEYRTRFDCVICKKTFYELKDRIATRNGIAGSSLFINGTPHIMCGNRDCNQPERLHDAKIIRIFPKWEEIEGVYVWTIHNGVPVRTVKTRFKPVLKSVK